MLCYTGIGRITSTLTCVVHVLCTCGPGAVCAGSVIDSMIGTVIGSMCASSICENSIENDDGAVMASSMGECSGEGIDSCVVVCKT